MPHPTHVQNFFHAVTNAPDYMSTQLQSDQWEWQKIMQSFLWASLDNFCLKLKSYRFLIYNTYEMEELILLFLSVWF